MDFFKDIFSEERVNGVKDAILAFSGLLIGIGVVFAFVLIGKIDPP